MVLAGAAVRVVPTPPGTPLAGFAARTSGSTGTHDPCTVRVVAVDETCWVTVDVCGLHEDTCAEIARAAGLPAAAVAVTATHTHAGPSCLPGRLGGHDAHVLMRVVDAAVDAIAEARAAREPAEVQVRRTRGLDVAVNRRDPDRPTDPELVLASLARPSGEVISWLACFACHPVVLSADNTLVSGDYPFFLRDELERAAPGSVALFVPGTAGDVNTGHPAEASYDAGMQPGRTMADAERIGRHLARAALAVVPDASDRWCARGRLGGLGPGAQPRGHSAARAAGPAAAGRAAGRLGGRAQDRCAGPGRPARHLDRLGGRTGPARRIRGRDDRSRPPLAGARHGDGLGRAAARRPSGRAGFLCLRRGDRRRCPAGSPQRGGAGAATSGSGRGVHQRLPGLLPGGGRLRGGRV